MTNYRGYLYELETDGTWFRCFVPITNYTGEWNDKGGAKRDAEVEIDRYIDGDK